MTASHGLMPSYSWFPLGEIPSPTPTSASECQDYTARCKPLRSSPRSIEEAKKLATSALSSRLLVVHDTVRRGNDDVAELARREEVADPLLVAISGHVESRAARQCVTPCGRRCDREPKYI